MIQTIALTKRYGNFLAVDNLHLSVEEGDCYGFIGPNGAGKTTTIRMLATLLQPTWGVARVCGYVVGMHSRKIRPLIGFVPDYFGAYEDMLVQEYLEFFAAAYGIRNPHRKRVVTDVLELTDLSVKISSPVNGLSRGMKQRLSIARVLLHNPKVLLLDEPASGLDPRARIEIRELLKELKRMGKTILISSHILSELAELCNKVGIIERGKLVAQGSINEIMRKVRQRTVLRIAVVGEAERARQLLESQGDVAEVRIEDGLLKVALATQVEDYSFLAKVLTDRGHKLLTFQEEPANLETAFMQLTQGLVQ
ncbi:MAG: ABC transporter ATP-binding protein [Planctomycetes bacterium]|nr:ABC transporter ATP-binding protein [Planctomycetota bacterium]